MLFATRSLARRIDSAECRMCSEYAEIQRASGADAFVAPLGGSAAVYAGAGIPYSKTIGVGLGEEPLDEAILARIEDDFRTRNTPLQVELASLADPSAGALLTRRRYTLVSVESLLGLALDSRFVETAQSGQKEDAARKLTVRRMAGSELPAFMDAVTTGFAHPDTFDGPASHESYERELLERVYRDSTQISGWTPYLAFLDGTLAGGAVLRFDTGVAQLCGAATLPQHRRCGVQTALLRARLVDAARQGCDVAVVTTQPGSKSQENVQKAGFTLLYQRNILVREPT
jgi:ribosomal protein S18 acetylase RimI-like enzyme